VTTPDLSQAIQAIEGLRGRFDDRKVDHLRDAMQAMQASLATHDWQGAMAAGKQLQAAGQDISGEFEHAALLDPHGFIQQHREAVEGGSATGLVV
jgi:hypothetical protein